MLRAGLEDSRPPVCVGHRPEPTHAGILKFFSWQSRQQRFAYLTDCSRTKEVQPKIYMVLRLILQHSKDDLLRSNHFGKLVDQASLDQCERDRPCQILTLLFIHHAAHLFFFATARSGTRI
jgi:hypothetical protein